MTPKILPTLWQCFSQKASLKKLTVKFPSTRDPRPMSVAPPIPSLEYLHIHDMDPLCYADDISSLLLGSKKLRNLKLHWSPRMRREREPSINPVAYFGKCEQADYFIPLKSFSVANMFISSSSFTRPICDMNLIEEVDVLNCSGGPDDSAATAFMEDESWKKAPKCGMPKLKSLRTDKISKSQLQFLETFGGLEKLYLINPYASRQYVSNGTANGNGICIPPSFTPSPLSPVSSDSSPGKTDPCLSGLKEAYLGIITKVHGPTLKHLLLPPQWRLNNDDIAIIVRRCPNLEQLAIGVEFASFQHLRLLLPFLTKLKAVRFLSNPEDPTFAEKMRELDNNGLHENKIGEQSANSEWSLVRWMELGRDDCIFELGSRYAYVNEDGTTVPRRAVTRRSRSAVADLGIWKMDSFEI